MLTHATPDLSQTFVDPCRDLITTFGFETVPQGPSDRGFVLIDQPLLFGRIVRVRIVVADEEGQSLVITGLLEEVVTSWVTT